MLSLYALWAGTSDLAVEKEEIEHRREPSLVVRDIFGREDEDI
jgi:hypothetical protein